MLSAGPSFTSLSAVKKISKRASRSSGTAAHAQGSRSSLRVDGKLKSFSRVHASFVQSMPKLPHGDDILASVRGHRHHKQGGQRANEKSDKTKQMHGADFHDYDALRASGLESRMLGFRSDSSQHISVSVLHGDGPGPT